MKRGCFYVVLSLMLVMWLAACGGGEEATPTAPATPAATPVATEAPAPTVAATATPTAQPAATVAPTPAATPAATAPAATPAATAVADTPAPAATEAPAIPAVDEALMAYAAEHAGGPGAIFVGDPMQLLGLPPHPGMMFDAPEEQYMQGAMAALFGVPEFGIDSHLFIYTSDYYKGLIEKAKLTNPTPLTSSGESIKIQHACILRQLPTCVLIQAYLAPNLAERTNGQVELSVVSFPELGLTGPETLEQVSDGTLDMVNIYAGYVAGSLPALEIQALWGMSADWETSYSILTSVAPEVDQIILEDTGGSPVLNRNWFAGSDNWFFSKKPLATLEDFEGITIRSHGAAISDFIAGMGAEAEFLGAAQTYVALELDQVDAAGYTLIPSLAQKLYEVSDYMAGPVIGFGYTNNVINKDVWEDIPEDIQQIMIEEGAKAELEALRLAPYENIVALQANQFLGVQPVPFSEEIREHIQTVVLPEHVYPGWVRRLGYPGKNEEIIKAANEKASPYTGWWVNEDGSIKSVPITKGPSAE